MNVILKGQLPVPDIEVLEMDKRVTTTFAVLAILLVVGVILGAILSDHTKLSVAFKSEVIGGALGVVAIPASIPCIIAWKSYNEEEKRLDQAEIDAHKTQIETHEKYIEAQQGNLKFPPSYTDYPPSYTSYSLDK